jgi:iron complex outermembrane receptor protein
VLSGETNSKGVELDIVAKPVEGLNIAGYSYNDMRFTKTSGLKGSFIEGDRLARTPANTANLSFSIHNLVHLKEFRFRNYIGKRVGGWNNQVDASLPNGIFDREIPLEGYTTIDVSVGYEWKKYRSCANFLTLQMS